MADQFIFAIPYSDSDLGTVVMVGTRLIIQRRRGGQALTTPTIPYWAGQSALIGGPASTQRPAFDALSEMFFNQTGMALPCSKDAAQFTNLRTAKGTLFKVLPIEVSEADLREMVKSTNLAIQDLTVIDGLFEQMEPVSIQAIDSTFGPTPVPEGGWNRFMYANYFQDYAPGPLDILPPTILAMLQRNTQQSDEMFLCALASIPEVPVKVNLVEFTVVGAAFNVETNSYTSPFNHGGPVQFTAITDSDDPLAPQLVAWTVDGADAGLGPTLTISDEQLTAKGAPLMIAARLGRSSLTTSLTVQPEFETFRVEGADTVTASDNGHRLAATANYSADAAPVEVVIKLNPDTPAAYEYVTWTGGQPVPQHPGDRRAVSRQNVTPLNTPVDVTAKLNPEFEAEVAILPTIAQVLVDGQAAPADGRVQVVWTGAVDQSVALRAVTVPDADAAWSHLVWTGGTAGAASNLRTVSLAGAVPGQPPIEVKVKTSDADEITLTIEVVPELLRIDVIGFGRATGAGTAQTFISNGPPCILQVVTNPPDPGVAAMAVWSNNVVGWRSADTRAAARNVAAPETRAITATIGAQTVQLDLDFVAMVPPTALGLDVETITFANTTPLIDDQAAPINQVWTAGQPAPPESFARTAVIQLSATLDLTATPAANTNINLRGTMWIPKADGTAAQIQWTAGPIAVAAAAVIGSTVNFPVAVADAALPDEVKYLCRDNAAAPLAAQRWPMQILWEMQVAGAAGWSQLGVTDHPTYVMQALPNVNALGYQTSFEIGCKNADGAGTVPQTLDGCYAAFEARALITGANAEMQRSSDGQALIYWFNWLFVPPAQHLPGMLASINGSGSCLAFSELMQDILYSQGIGAGVIHQVLPNLVLAPAATGFAVNNWLFNPLTALVPFAAWNYTNNPAGGANTAHWQVGPGQNQQNPPPIFGNHFIIDDGGTYYDPSYGTAVQATFEDWSRTSIGALSRPALPNIGYAGPPAPGTSVTV